MRAKTYSRATISRLSLNRNNPVNTHSVVTNGVQPSILISSTLLRLPLLHLPKPPKRRVPVFGPNCGNVSQVRRRRLKLKPRHVIRVSALEDGLIPAGRPRVGGTIAAVMAVGKIAEPILIRTGAGVRTRVPTQNHERMGRAKIPGRLKPVINRRGVLAAVEAARAVSAMETDRFSQISLPVQGIPLATVRKIPRLCRRVPQLARTPETKRRGQPDNRFLMPADLGGAYE